MYMRSSGHNKYAKYNIDDFPANYSGQYTRDSLKKENIPEPEPGGIKKLPEHNPQNPHKHDSENKPDAPRGGDKKGGILSGLFKRGEDNKNGGILSNFELEDLILVAVIFFLLKDGMEDDLIIILAMILFSQ